MKLMVIDGNSIVNRAFYGVRMLNAPDGTPTNGIYGFLNILQRLLKEEKPDGVCVTFDVHAPTFRHKVYEEYKATRKKMPEELRVQMPILKEVLDALRIPHYELAGYEADDIIGHISKECELAGWDCCVVTGDRDSFQLISDTTVVKFVRTGSAKTDMELYDKEKFVSEYGFEPARIVDLKALMGDSSDNIPGVTGIGEKTARDLLQKFGSLDNIYADIGSLNIKEGVRKKLIVGEEQARMSYNLATICRDVPLSFSPDENTCQEPDREKLLSIFERLNFRRFIEKFNLKGSGEPAESENSQLSYVVQEVRTEAECEDMENKLSGSVVSVRFSENASEVAAAIPGRVYVVRETSEFYERIIKILSSEHVKKTGHHIKDDMRRFLEKGFPSKGWIFDTALAAYILEQTSKDYDIARLCEKYCGVTITDKKSASGEGEVAEHERFVEEAAAGPVLYEKLNVKLEDEGLMPLFRNIEMPLCPVLASMEERGFLIDKEALAGFGEQLSGQIESLTGEIYDLAGEEFNINSPKQLGEILFDKLMLPAPKKTKTGYSTNADVLEKLRNKHPIAGMILEYRELTKLKSTYADGLLKVTDDTGRIHTNFQMTVTATGRLSSVEPNLQNIPIRRELGGEIRKMFVADEGMVLVDADYSQIELRLLAHISGDEVMREAFISGQDIHRITASQVFGVPPEEVTPSMRSHAKAVNFGIVYGISDFSLAQDIGISRNEAGRYIDSYLEKYSGVREYMGRIVEKARSDGYVETLYGRRRAIPELKSSNYHTRAFGERVALNMPVQGTAADIMKIAMINVEKRLRKENLHARLILQVHDELVAECPLCEAEVTAVILKEEMENAAILSVPLTVDTGIGTNWFDAH